VFPVCKTDLSPHFPLAWALGIHQPDLSCCWKRRLCGCKEKIINCTICGCWWCLHLLFTCMQLIHNQRYNFPVFYKNLNHIFHSAPGLAFFQTQKRIKKVFFPSEFLRQERESLEIKNYAQVLQWIWPSSASPFFLGATVSFVAGGFAEGAAAAATVDFSSWVVVVEAAARVSAAAAPGATVEFPASSTWEGGGVAGAIRLPSWIELAEDGVGTGIAGGGSCGNTLHHTPCPSFSVKDIQ